MQSLSDVFISRLQDATATVIHGVWTQFDNKDLRGVCDHTSHRHEHQSTEGVCPQSTRVSPRASAMHLNSSPQACHTCTRCLLPDITLGMVKVDRNQPYQCKLTLAHNRVSASPFWPLILQCTSLPQTRCCLPKTFSNFQGPESLRTYLQSYLF